MKKTLLYLLAIFMFQCAYSQNIYYVDANATGNNTGTSWTNAYTQLNRALRALSPGSEIWVAQGTYYADDAPGITIGDRNASFVIKNGMKIRGGFPSGGGTIQERDWNAHPTIMSGDIGAQGNHSDNTANIILTVNVSSNTLLDGFIVEYGRATITSPQAQRGAAWYNDVDNGATSLPKAINCTFRNNSSITEGGAIYINADNGARAGIYFNNCIFSNNTTTSAVNGFGGAIYAAARNDATVDVEISNCSFLDNVGRNGGAISNTSRTGASVLFTVLNSLFDGNSSNGSGGAVRALGSRDGVGGPFTSFNRTRFINCTFSNNETASSSGGAAALFFRTASISGIYNTIIWGNSPSNNQMSVDQSDAVAFASTVENVVGQDPLFVNTATRDFRLQPGSPAINTGINQYNEQPTDLDGNLRIVGLTVDQGAYESPSGSLPEFITEWKTDNPGASANNQIRLPIFGSLGTAYNYTVAWGDGTSDTFTTGGLGDVTHTYPAPGTYQVKISGSFPRIVFNGSGDRQKILKVLNWGNIQWSSMDSAFEGCSNLRIEATDKPDLSNAMSLNEMFKNATSLNDNLNHWNVSTINSMIGTFEGATAFNTDLSNWDVSNVTLMARMFQDASSFNRPLDMWQTSNLQNTGAMFRRASGFNQNIGTWNVSNVTEFISMFEDATAFNQDIGTWDTGSAETFASMFAGATSFDQDLGGWDVSSLSTAFPDSIDGANNMFVGVTLSTSNYDNLLIGWNTLDAGETAIPNNIPFHGGNSTYCAGASARADLINTHNWAITDGGTIPPVAVCQDITAFLDASGNVSILATDLDGGSSGACGTITFSASQTEFTCSDLGANTVTLTVTDVASGNFSQCTATVTIVDNTPPTISCPAAIAVNNDLGICEAFVSVPQPFYSDNCSEAAFALEFDGTDDYVTAGLPALFNDIANTDFTIEMWANPSSFETQRLFFAQKDANEFVSILLNTSGQVYLFVNNEYSAQAPTAIPLNTWTHIAIRWTAATNNGEVFINGDLQATNSGGSSSLGADTIMAIGSRSDGTQNFHGQLDEIRIWREARSNTDILNNYQGCVSPSETNLEAYYTLNDGIGSLVATDNSGNGYNGTLTNMDSNTSWIAGYINCSELILVNDYNNTNSASSVYPVGDTVVTWTATDASGNVSTCAQTITVTDAENPVANCAAPFTIQLDANGTASLTVADIENGSTDNCGIASTTIDITAFDCSNVGDNTVMLTVTDVNGNTSTCTTIVTVEDNVAPVANCAAPFTIQLDANGNASITAADIENGSTDACGIASTSIDITDFTCADVGPNTVTLTVTDVNGNTSTCTTIVTVEDNVPPVANCAAPFTIQLDANGNASITVADIENGSTDACGIASNTIDITDFDCSNVGQNTVTLTVADVNGNTSTCTTIVTVEDSIAPTIVCPANITANTDAGECFATASFPMPIAFDNCGVDTIVQTAGLPSGSQFPVGVNTVEFTATDVNGNESTCSFTITVVDNEAPIAVCQNITIQLDANGNASITAADVDGGSTDQCGVASTTIDMDTFDCSHVGDNNVILTVTDVNGNVSTCTAIVTVEDVTAPVVACQNITVELDPVMGTVTIAGTDIDNGSTDACGIASYDLDIDTFDCSNIGDNTVVLTITDVNGNTATCTAIVTVEDNTSPVLVCQDFTIEIGADGTATLDPSDVIASNDDACGILTVAVDITQFSCADIGTPVTVQVFSQDNNGNLSTCTATVTAVDLLAPVITCPLDQTVDPGVGNLFYILPDYFAIGEATAIDNCTDPVTITTQDPTAGTALADGVYTITLTATDEYGNVGTCEFELTVDSVLGFGDHSQDLGSVTMYPNPAKAHVTIGNPQGLELEQADIYDLRGRLVNSFSLKGMANEKTMNIEALAAATYVVIIKGKHGQITKRLLKE